MKNISGKICQRKYYYHCYPNYDSIQIKNLVFGPVFEQVNRGVRQQVRRQMIKNILIEMKYGDYKMNNVILKVSNTSSSVYPSYEMQSRVINLVVIPVVRVINFNSVLLALSLRVQEVHEINYRNETTLTNLGII